MVFNSKASRKQFETMSLRYSNHSLIDITKGIYKVNQNNLKPQDFLELAKHITLQEYGLKETFGEKGVEELKNRLEYSATLMQPVDNEYKNKCYSNVGHFLCDLLKMGTYPQGFYDKLAYFVECHCPSAIALKEMKKDDYLPKFSIAVASVGSDLDAVIEILFGDQTLQVSTILIQESLKEELKIKLSTRCANFLANGYTTGLELETLAISNEAKKMGAKVGEFKSSSNIMAFVYDLLPLKSFKQGNVLFIMPFRSAAEAVKLSTSVNFIAASVWGDSSTALSIAQSLKCNNVWINCHGLTHPGVPLYPRPVSHVPPFDTKNCMIKLWGLPQLENYYHIIRRWVIVPNVSLPNGRNLLVRPLGPVGTITIPWVENCENLIFAALACGNRIIIHYWQEMNDNKNKIASFIDLFSELLPTGVLKIAGTDRDESGFAFINQRKVPLMDLQSDHAIVTNMMKTQYIWLNESQPL